MGLSRVINEQLKSEHQIFIAEMGARHVGDIKELCELVHPRYGLLTSVGPQHLETFGSIENIAGTKYELIEALPEDGIAFFSSDGSYVDRLFAKCEREKYRVGFNPDRQPYMLATDIEVSPQGQPLHPQVRRRRIAALPHEAAWQATTSRTSPSARPWPANWA